MTVLRVLVLTEDSGKQAIPTIQTLIRSAFRLLSPAHNPQCVTFQPLPANEAAVRACRANSWKDRRSVDRPRLLGLIAGHLRQEGTIVVFHVDSDTAWADREESENRRKFEEIIRGGVRAVLRGSAPNPVSTRSPQYLDPPQADAALERLLVMHPCYSIESWLFQAVDEVSARCLERHRQPEHQLRIESWATDRTLLDEVLRPKELLDCVGDRHNEALAGHFPAAAVHAGGRSWAEFVEALSRTRLVSRLSTPAEHRS